MATPVPNKLNTDDGNEEVCGACQKGGDLMCCEECPAAFHFRCAGYCDEDDVPDGDWFCWFCAKARNRTFHPVKLFEPQKNNMRIRLATDATCEVFVECKRLELNAEDMLVQPVGQKAPAERVSRRDPRVWHGSLEKAAWTQVDKILFRPNSRLFAIDKNKLAELLTNPGAQLLQPPGPSSVKASTPTAASSEGADDDIIQPKPGVQLDYRDTDEREFMEALDTWWEQREPEGRKPINHRHRELSPYTLWFHVFQFGGPAEVNMHNLWIEVGRKFPELADAAPPILTSTPQRLYHSTIKPFLKAILRGEVKFPLPIRAKLSAKKAAKPPGLAAKAPGRGSGVKVTGVKRSAGPSPAVPASKRQNSVSLNPTLPDCNSSALSPGRTLCVNEVEPTEDAMSLKVGDVVEFRSLGDGRKGGWFMGHISQVVEAPAMEGGRRLMVTYGTNCSTYQGWREWIPLVWRGSRKDPLPVPVVMVRRPSTCPAGHASRLGEFVEAEKQGVWWVGHIAELHDKGFVRIQEQQPPLGEGHVWHVTQPEVRQLPPSASPSDSGPGMGMVTFPGPKILKSVLAARLQAELVKSADDPTQMYGVVLAPLAPVRASKLEELDGPKMAAGRAAARLGAHEQGFKVKQEDTGAGVSRTAEGNFVDVQDSTGMHS